MFFYRPTFFEGFNLPIQRPAPYPRHAVSLTKFSKLSPYFLENATFALFYPLTHNSELYSITNDIQQVNNKE